MYYDFTVPIPEVKGKITLMRKGKLTYVQLETGRVYYPKKRYTIPQRVSIGKVDPKHPELMYPNDKYAVYPMSRTVIKTLNPIFRHFKNGNPDNGQ